MSDSFRDRADLQRRQIYHQQLLDSQRFGARAEQASARDNSGVREGSGEGAWLGGAAFLLAFLCLPLAVLSMLVALPAMFLVLVADRILSGYWGGGFREAFVATAMGVFVYLVVTLSIGVIVCVFREQLFGLGGLGTVSETMVELCSRALDSLSTIGSGDLSLVELLGADSSDGATLLRTAAIAALHGPGVLLSAAVLCWRIGAPFSDVKGGLVALLSSAIFCPFGAGLVLWAVARLI